MKSKEQKRDEAHARGMKSNYVPEEKPCCKCKAYSNTVCKDQVLHTPRKGTCKDWRKA